MLSAIPSAVRMIPSEIRVQFVAPRSLDHRLVVLRSENDVVMQAEVC
jgi:hypothetical protein